MTQNGLLKALWSALVKLLNDLNNLLYTKNSKLFKRLEKFRNFGPLLSRIPDTLIYSYRDYEIKIASTKSCYTLMPFFKKKLLLLRIPIFYTNSNNYFESCQICSYTISRTSITISQTKRTKSELFNIKILAVIVDT